MFTGSMGRISVFCSYAREDEDVRRSLEDVLAPLRDEKIIDDWYDSRIQPGARWNAEIEAVLTSLAAVGGSSADASAVGAKARTTRAR